MVLPEAVGAQSRNELGRSGKGGPYLQGVVTAASPYRRILFIYEKGDAEADLRRRSGPRRGAQGNFTVALPETGRGTQA